jgi:hypothetical protein
MAEDARHMQFRRAFRDVIEKEDLFLQARARAQLLRALGLENQRLVDRVCARLPAGLIHMRHGVRVWRMATRERQHDIVGQHRIKRIRLYVEVSGHGGFPPQTATTIGDEITMTRYAF